MKKSIKNANFGSRKWFWLSIIVASFAMASRLRNDVHPQKGVYYI
jgi:hypothetical protein